MVKLMDHLLDLESDDLEGDIYQCGICEEQFTRLKGFLYHKKDKCSRKPQLVSDIPVSMFFESDNMRYHNTLFKEGSKHLD